MAAIPWSRGRGRFALVGAVLALGVVATATASACVPQARLVSLQPRPSGPAGSQVTVEGVGFDPGTAEVRWNGPGGTLLAIAEGPSFSVPIAVPDVPPGLYAVVVLMRLPDGGVGNAGSAAFDVTGEGAAGTRAPVTVATTPPAPTASRPDPAPATSPILAMAAGAGILALGALGGARLARRPGAETH